MELLDNLHKKIGIVLRAHFLPSHLPTSLSHYEHYPTSAKCELYPAWDSKGEYAKTAPSRVAGSRLKR